MTPLIQRGLLSVRQSVASDIQPIAQNMRLADCNEIMASHNILPEPALLAGLEFSTICLTVCVKDKPVAMCGVAAQHPTSNIGSVWLLATPDLERAWLCFGIFGKQVMAKFLEDYVTLYNYVDVRNKKSIHWLRSLGAKFEDPKPYGPGKLPFMYFTIERA